MSYVFAGATGDDLLGAMARLASHFGVKRLLLEGGGKINGAFPKHKLIDEFSTLIRPWMGLPVIATPRPKALLFRSIFFQPRQTGAMPFRSDGRAC